MKKQNYILGIDIGNSKICSLIADICGSEPQILGVGIAPSHGIQKGNIKSIDSVATALQKSLDKARQMAGVEVSRAFIALSGNCVRSENIREMINLVPNCEIGFSEAINLLPNCEISAKEINKSFGIIRKVGEQKGLPYACFSTAIGLILYAFGESTNCELDANGKIKFR